MKTAKAADAKLKAEKAAKAEKEAKDGKDGKGAKEGKAAAGGASKGDGEQTGQSAGGKAAKAPKVFFANDADVEEKSKKPLPAPLPAKRKSMLTRLVVMLNWEAVRCLARMSA